LSIEGTKIAAVTPYAAKEKLQAVPGGRWKPSAKRWEYDATPRTARLLVDAVGNYGTTPEVDELAAEWVTVYDIVDRVAEGEVVETSELMRYPPRSNQKVGVLMFRLMAGVGLGWGMGSGKTYGMVSACADLIDARRAEGVEGCLGMVFIAAPSVVVRGVWPGEFEKHLLDWSRHVEISAMPKGTSTAARVKDAERKLRYAERGNKLFVCVVTIDSCIYETIGKFVRKHDWDIGCIDEIHRCATPGAKITRWLDTTLRPRSAKRVGLTGTLFRNNELDAFCPVRFLEPSIFGNSAAKFRAQHATFDRFDRPVGVADPDKVRSLVGEVFHFVETRDVVDLPPITHSEHYVQLGKEGRKKYDEMERDSVLELDRGVMTAENKLTLAMRLHQIASGFLRYETLDGDEVGVRVDDAKQEALEYLLESVPPEEPIVVFTVYKSDVSIVREACLNVGRRCYELSGAVDEFADWKSASGGEVIAANLRSAREGIDMTRSCNAIFYSFGYSRADYDQATSRIDRPGQTRPVMVTRIVAERTVDVAVVKALTKKGDTIEAAIAYMKSRYASGDESE
tara:strand:+ start:13250 stop:14950 length:1701 start_codon:yes stop_codon:yes gene_type:complete